MSLRVLIVDDTAVFRRILGDALTGVPDIEVVGSAPNGRLALARMGALRPDLVTLDIEMPEMNGIELLEALKSGGVEAGVIVVSSLTMRGGEMTVKALELGAFDFVTKPERGSPEANLAQLRGQLLPVIDAFRRRREISSILRGGHQTVCAGVAPVSGAVPQAGRKWRHCSAPMVLIGVSTGGPGALATLVPALPGDLGAPIFIVQHMPPIFTQSLAASLDKKSSVRVKEAEDGEIPRANSAYIAPGGKHMKLTPGPNGEMVVRLTDDPLEQGCRPSVDYLFRSVALNFPGRAVAAILTGMGADGTNGLRMLKRGGCFAIAQDEQSCVVFGMPKEAISAGVIDTVEPLTRIAGTIVRSVREARP